MKARIAAIAFALFLTMCSATRGADVPKNTLKAEDQNTKVLLYEGQSCTKKEVLDVLPETMRSEWQAGMLYMDAHSFEMCWTRKGPHAVLLVVMGDDVVLASVLYSAFRKVEGV